MAEWVRYGAESRGQEVDEVGYLCRALISFLLCKCVGSAISKMTEDIFYGECFDMLVCPVGQKLHGCNLFLLVRSAEWTFLFPGEAEESIHCARSRLPTYSIDGWMDGLGIWCSTISVPSEGYVNSPE